MINEEFIKRTINRCYPQKWLCMIPKKALNHAQEFEEGWEVIKEFILKWQDAGLVKIVKFPEGITKNDTCIEALQFLDGKPFPVN